MINLGLNFCPNFQFLMVLGTENRGDRNVGNRLGPWRLMFIYLSKMQFLCKNLISVPAWYSKLIGDYFYNRQIELLTRGEDDT
jgi:hypothetical protein